MDPNSHPQEEIKIRLDPRINEQAKNTNGMKGERCNNCGGYGFTMSLKGGKIPCTQCKETGVREPTNLELQAQIANMKQDLENLREALRETLMGKGIKLKQTIDEVE